MLKGNVRGTSRAATSAFPSGVTASTSPLPQLHSPTRPPCHLVDSGKPNPSSRTRGPITVIPPVEPRSRSPAVSRRSGQVTAMTNAGGSDRHSGEFGGADRRQQPRGPSARRRPALHLDDHVRQRRPTTALVQPE